MRRLKIYDHHAQPGAFPFETLDGEVLRCVSTAFAAPGGDLILFTEDGKAYGPTTLKPHQHVRLARYDDAIESQRHKIPAEGGED